MQRSKRVRRTSDEALFHHEADVRHQRRATATQHVVSKSAIGAMRRCSHRLDDAAFASVLTKKTPTNTHIPTRIGAALRTSPNCPARARMKYRARMNSSVDRPLAIRSRLGSTKNFPPNAA